MKTMGLGLLEIDLSSRSYRMADASAEARTYLGGRGMGAKLLWDRVPPGADPLGPENILYFGAGPLTGCFGSVVNVSARSPLTLLRGESNMNGHFGAELAHAGCGAGIILTGRSEQPVYLVVGNGRVDFRDAGRLWGKLNLETQQAIHDELGSDVRIVAIGPAGENMVRNAGICHDFYHYAARLGMGAVMGSKRVKAIAVRGSGAPNYAQPAELFGMVSKFFRESRDYVAKHRRWGHATSPPRNYYLAREGVKNKQLGWHEVCDGANPLLMEQQYKLWNDSCSLCPVACKVPYMRREPPLGPVAGELRHDNACSGGFLRGHAGRYGRVQSPY